MEANNMKAMREALKQARVAMVAVVESVGGEENEEVLKAIDAALAEPPRNCDVGTLEDRVDRFARYCEKNGECKTCPAYLKGDMDCHIAWSDMPYNESEKLNA